MERIDRRQLLAAGGGAAVLSAVMGGMAAAQQPRPVPGTVMQYLLRFNVVIDPSTIDQTRTPATAGQVTTGPFYFAGPIYDEGDVNADGSVRSGAVLRGTHRAFGWVFDPRTPNAGAIHSFDIFGEGELVANGTTVGSSTTIAGGTGTYKTAQGELRAAIINAAAGAYLMEFELTLESPGR
jgi:hypothetical protein